MRNNKVLEFLGEFGVHLTLEEIVAARTPNGGFSKEQLSKWGVPWPPPKGWAKRLQRGEPINLSKRQLKKRRKKRRDEKEAILRDGWSGAVLKDGTKLTYRDYIDSEHWLAVRVRYRNSKMPQECLVCGSERFDLHHRTYRRLGHERLHDLVPLCREHHNQVHRKIREKTGKTTSWNGHKLVG